jgi:hypothetical protein
MGLAILVVAVAGVAGRLCAGRGGRIRGHRLRSPALLAGAAAVLIAEPLVASSLSYAYPMAMLVAAILFLQFSLRNLHVPGVPLAALGLLLNTLVVVSNGAMPVEQRASARAGMAATGVSSAAEHRHELADGGTRFRVLGDRVAVPIPFHREVDSLGDVALAAGAGLFVFTALRRRRGVFDPTDSWTLQRA